MILNTKCIWLGTYNRWSGIIFGFNWIYLHIYSFSSGQCTCTWVSTRIFFIPKIQDMIQNSIFYLFQYIDIEKKTQNKLQYCASLGQLTLVVDSKQLARNRQSIYRKNHELFSVIYSGSDEKVKPFIAYSSSWILNLYYFHWLINMMALCKPPLI